MIADDIEHSSRLGKEGMCIKGNIADVKIQNDLQQSLKNFGFKRQHKAKGKDKGLHKASRSTGSTAPSPSLPSLHATPFTSGPNPAPMQRDPTPDRATFPANTVAGPSVDKSAQGVLSQPSGTSYSHPHNHCCPSHAPSASWSGPCNASMTPAFELSATPVGHAHASCCSGHAPSASWSGPYRPHMAPASGPLHHLSNPAFTRPEVARVPEGYGSGYRSGTGNGPGCGSQPIDAHQAREDLLKTMFREERYSLPVSDEELLSAAAFVDGTHIPFAVPLGSEFHQSGVVLEYPELPNSNFQIDAPWSKSASIHTIYEGPTKEASPSSPRPSGAVPPPSLASSKPPPGAMPPLGIGALLRTEGDLQVPRAPTVPPKDAWKPEAEEVRTPRLKDIHLPTNGTEPAITLQPPTTTDLTAATSKANSSPVAGGNPVTESSLTQERPKWDSPAPVQTDERESFVTAQSQPQLPAYQSQPTSPSKVMLSESDAKSYFPETPGVSEDIERPEGLSYSPSNATKTEEKREIIGRTAPDLSTVSPPMPRTQPQGRVPRGVDSMRSPDTMTTTFTLLGSRELQPSDIVTERLYAWAGEKAEHDFVETLERLSGGEEVRASSSLPLSLLLPAVTLRRS